jgi:predicted component of type VI protein secretion system
MGDILETVAATPPTLKADGEEQFKRVDLHLVRINQRFAQLEELIRSDAERTRRHFDVVAEQMNAGRHLVLAIGLARAANGMSASIADDSELVQKTLADHEARLRQLEQKANPA